MSEQSLYSEVKKRKLAAPSKAKVVKAVEQHGKILSITGRYDKPERVMNYTYASVKDTIKPSHFGKVDINKYDLVVIGCPGNEIPSQYHHRIREYVENGGWILSTDWVLRTIVEPIFPGYIRWNNEKTADVVVACQIVDPNHPFMDGVVDALKTFGSKGGKNLGPKSAKKQHPAMMDSFKWWLEDKSFPIEVLRKDKVKVLIESYEIRKKWGAGPVFVYFPFGKGLVAHFISHTHLQKGAAKGKFASAIIITNLLDECIKFKYGIEAGRQRGGYQDTTFNPMAGGIASSDNWQDSFQKVSAAPSYPEPSVAPGQQYDPYAYPQQQPAQQYPAYAATPEPDPAQGIIPDFGGVAQATEVQVLHDRTKTCVVCGGDFQDTSIRVMECGSCHALYHEQCLQQQIDYEGVCKSCSNVLLY